MCGAILRAVANNDELSGRVRSVVVGVPGWLRVTSEAVKTDGDLERWVRRGVAYARSLSPQ